MITQHLEAASITAALKKTARADRVLITAFGELWNFRADKVRLALKVWVGATVEIESVTGNLVFRRGSGYLKLYPGTTASKVVKRGGYRTTARATSILPERPAMVEAVHAA